MAKRETLRQQVNENREIDRTQKRVVTKHNGTFQGEKINTKEN